MADSDVDHTALKQAIDSILLTHATILDESSSDNDAQYRVEEETAYLKTSIIRDITHDEHVLVPDMESDTESDGDDEDSDDEDSDDGDDSSTYKPEDAEDAGDVEFFGVTMEGYENEEGEEATELPQTRSVTGIMRARLARARTIATEARISVLTQLVNEINDNDILKNDSELRFLVAYLNRVNNLDIDTLIKQSGGKIRTRTNKKSKTNKR